MHPLCTAAVQLQEEGILSPTLPASTTTRLISAATAAARGPRSPAFPPHCFPRCDDSVVNFFCLRPCLARLPPSQCMCLRLTAAAAASSCGGCPRCLRVLLLWRPLKPICMACCHSLPQLPECPACHTSPYRTRVPGWWSCRQVEQAFLRAGKRWVRSGARQQAQCGGEGSASGWPDIQRSELFVLLHHIHWVAHRCSIIWLLLSRTT